MDTLWTKCLDQLQSEISAQQFNTWLRPLQVDFPTDERVVLLAPNQFVLDHVSKHYLDRITLALQHCTGNPIIVNLTIGSRTTPATMKQAPTPSLAAPKQTKFESHLNSAIIF